MAEDKIFPSGFILKEPRDTAPDWVKGSISIKVSDFIPFLKEHEKKGWVNLEMKVGQSGKLYTELDTWEPKKQDTQPDTKSQADDDDVF